MKDKSCGNCVNCEKYIVDGVEKWSCENWERIQYRPSYAHRKGVGREKYTTRRCCWRGERHEARLELCS